MFFPIREIICVFTILIFNPLILDRSVEERKWLEITFEKKWSIDASEYQLFKPGRGFQVDDSHQIYISDIGDHTVKMFNSEGNFVRTFGKEKGAGPGEIQHLIAFDVDYEGNLWIADPANSRITIFQNDGSFNKHIPLEIIPYRIAIQDKGDFLYIMNQNASSDGKFSRISASSKNFKSFGNDIIKDQMRNNIVLSGEIAVNQNDNLYYSPDYAGLLLGFDSKGNELFKKQEIFSTPFPKVNFDERGGSWVDRDAVRVSRGIFTDKKGRVAIFSYAPPQNEERFLDFYDQETGEYLNSMKLPERAYRVYLKEDILYTLKYTKSDVTISAWQVIQETND